MNVLITGAAGYIGSILTPMLLENGHKVTAIDNFMYRQNSLLQLCHNKNFNIIKGDVRNSSMLKEQVSKADIIIPLAAIVGMPACNNNPSLAKEVNQDAIQNIIKFKSKEQIVLFPNTNSGYGQGEGALFTEENVLNPISVYGVTKVEAEKSVLNADNTIVFRLATVFGASPKMRLDLLVNDFTYKAWNDRYIILFEAHFIRNYVSVHDVAKLFNWSIDNFDITKNQIFNFGLSNANLSKYDLCKKIQSILPDFHITVTDIGTDPDKRNYMVSNEKIEKFGFKAEISVEDGIQELLKSFQIIQPNIYSNII